MAHPGAVGSGVNDSISSTCDGMYLPHTGAEGVNESLWSQSALLCYTCSRCQSWREELQGLNLAQVGADHEEEQIAGPHSGSEV